MAIGPLSWYKRLIAPGGFRASVLTLLSGAAVALLLAYLAKPVLTRLYTPEAFGLADVFVALLGVLIPISSLRYEDALMLPGDNRAAASVLALAATLVVGFVALAGVLLFWRDAFAGFLGAPALASWLWLLPPALLVMRAAKLSELWLTRMKRFRPISAAQATQAGAMVTVRIGAGLPPIQAGAGGLIGGFVFGHTVAAALLLWAALRRSGSLFREAFRGLHLRDPARRYRRFPLFSMPSTLLSALVTRMPFFLLLPFFGQSVVGLFGLAFNALLIPLSLVGAAVAQVFFVHAAEAHRDGTLAGLTTTVHRRLVMIGLFPTLALLLAGPDVFDFVFSAAWRTSGRYVQYVGPWLFLSAVASPLTRLFDVLERQRLDLAVSFTMFVVLAGALFWGGRTGDAELCLTALGLAGGTVRAAQIVILTRLSGVSWGDLAHPYLRYLLLALPFLLMVAAAMTANRPWLTTLATALAGIGYAAFLARTEDLFSTRAAKP
ncbi:lipopolysaccharide biosynthesis protein [Rhodocaloribacter sp.]